MRLDVETNPLVDALDRGRGPADSRPPEACHVVVDRDGAVARVAELASFAVRAGPAEPRLGVFEDVE
ncbi:hypothetical protein [Streptomyces sp. NPDC051014]|uniref:hypothetical protein n=1 Tax=Streptomyces sp. NPDC051014 TaxID=3155751 RepID=UPI0033DDC08D